MRRRILICICLVLALMASANAVVYVDLSTPPGGDGTSWACAFNELQPAIEAAYVRGEEIWVAMGDYGEQRVVEPGDIPDWPPEDSGALVMMPGVEMYGGFAGDETMREQRDWQNNVTIINGTTANNGGPACHVVFGAEDAVLDGFRVTGANLTLESGCTNSGGGMVITEPMTVRNCRFESNFVQGSGGGMYIVNCAPLIEDCVFLGNSAVNGAAMVNSIGAPTINRCQFVQNRAFGFRDVGANGGGIANYGSTPVILNCIFWNNLGESPFGVPSYGGGMSSVMSSSVYAVNCTFYGNVVINDSPLTTNYGGGVYAQAGSATALVNCILWNNEPDQIFGDVSAIYSNVQGGYTGTGNISGDPMFFNPDAGDFRLMPGSPSIDTGTAAGAPDVDIRLVPRPQGAGFDMGAYEMEGETPPEAAFTADVTTGPAPLTVQFTDQSTGDITSWLWDFGDSTTSTGQNPVHTYMAPGSYTVSLTVANTGSDTETRVDYIVVTPAEEELTASFDYAPNFGMRPLVVQFTDTSTSTSPITSWYWRFGDGSKSTEQNPAHEYRVPGLFSVSLTVTTDGMTDTYTVRYAVLVINKNGKTPKPWLRRWLNGGDEVDWKKLEGR